MDPIIQIKSTTVVLPYDDIDTDQIIPARYINTNTKEGLGEHLFTDWRHDKNGEERLDFPLNDPKSRKATILVAGHNFGCGSSREHAPWALLDYGIRAVISTEIADIFRNNSLKNGLIPVIVNVESHQWLLSHPGAEVTVSLEESSLIIEQQELLNFSIDPFSRYCLMNGLDQLGFLTDREEQIANYESKQ